jgi:hypothetical protein
MKDERGRKRPFGVFWGAIGTAAKQTMSESATRADSVFVPYEIL